MGVVIGTSPGRVMGWSDVHVWYAVSVEAWSVTGSSQQGRAWSSGGGGPVSRAVTAGPDTGPGPLKPAGGGGGANRPAEPVVAGQVLYGGLPPACRWCAGAAGRGQVTRT